MDDFLKLSTDSTVPRIELSRDQLAALGLGEVAYVRAMRPDELPDELQRQLDTAPGAKVYALHQADGAPILIAETRDLAIAGAIEHKLAPIALH